MISEKVIYAMPYRSAIILVSFVFHLWLRRTDRKKMSTDHLISQTVQIAATRSLPLVAKNGSKKCAVVFERVEKSWKVIFHSCRQYRRISRGSFAPLSTPPLLFFHYENAQHANQKLLSRQGVRRQDTGIRSRCQESGIRSQGTGVSILPLSLYPFHHFTGGWKPPLRRQTSPRSVPAFPRLFKETEHPYGPDPRLKLRLNRRKLDFKST